MDKRSLKKYRPKKKPDLLIDVSSTDVISNKNIRKVAKMASIANFTGVYSAEDEHNYAIANKMKKHYCSANLADYIDLPKAKTDVAVIGHKQPLTETTEKNLVKFLKTHPHEDMFGHVYKVDDEGVKIKRFFG